MGQHSETEGLSYIPYDKVEANPYNPRELFDRAQLDLLKESIRQVGVLVPLLVYRRKRDSQIVIMDGERRWRCVSELVKEYPEESAKWINLPANVVSEPDMVSNILRMFNIHNVRQPWELMPTALKLDIIMHELKERDEDKLAALTGLSASNVRRCKILLEYEKEFQDTMMEPDPEKRIRADFYIELAPVLNLIKKNLPNISKKFSKLELTRKFLEKYRNGEITNVIDFRDLADLIRQMKKGEIEVHECEKIFLDLLSTKLELKSIVSKTYHPMKKIDDLQKTVETTIDQVNLFQPTTVKERDKIQKVLEELTEVIKKKINELEKFEERE